MGGEGGWFPQKPGLIHKVVFCHRSEMSSDDQVDTVEYLTRVASMTMGLREQLEIIKIINPDARVLATDTEFVIGMCIYST